MERPVPAKKKTAGSRPSPGRRKPKNPGLIRVKSKESPAALNFSRGETKRFYQLETLANSMEGLVNRGDSWLMAALLEATQGLAPLAISLEQIWENNYSLAYKLTASVSQGRPGHLLLVCAKNHQEHSVRLQAEIDCIRQLTVRPESGLLPIRSEGSFYLPNKHERSDGKGRKVLAYLRAWTGPFAGIDLRDSGQYVLIDNERRLMSRRDSEAFGESLASLLLHALDPATRTGPSLNALHWGDIVCRVGRTVVSPCVVHCPLVTRYRSIQAYLKGLLLWEPAPGTGIYPIQMVAPEKLAELLGEVFGKELAAEAARRLSVVGGEASVPAPYVESLREALQD